MGLPKQRYVQFRLQWSFGTFSQLLLCSRCVYSIGSDWCDGCGYYQHILLSGIFGKTERKVAKRCVPSSTFKVMMEALRATVCLRVVINISFFHYQGVTVNIWSRESKTLERRSNIISGKCVNVASRIICEISDHPLFEKNDVINHVSTLVFVDENHSLFAPVDLYTTTSIAVSYTNSSWTTESCTEQELRQLIQYHDYYFLVVETEAIDESTPAPGRKTLSKSRGREIAHGSSSRFIVSLPRNNDVFAVCCGLLLAKLLVVQYTPPEDASATQRNISSVCSVTFDLTLFGSIVERVLGRKRKQQQSQNRWWRRIVHKILGIQRRRRISGSAVEFW